MNRPGDSVTDEEFRRQAGCDGKLRHESIEAAEQHIASASRRFRNRPSAKQGMKIRPYLCTFCQGYHVGHTKGPAYRKGKKGFK